MGGGGLILFIFIVSYILTKIKDPPKPRKKRGVKSDFK